MPIIVRGRQDDVNADAMEMLRMQQANVGAASRGAYGIGSAIAAAAKRKEKQGAQADHAAIEGFFMERSAGLAEGEPEAQSTQMRSGLSDPGTEQGDAGGMPMQKGRPAAERPAQQQMSRPSARWEPEFAAWSRSTLEKGRAFAEKLTPEGRAVFASKLGDYLKNAQVQASTRATVDRYQDTLVGMRRAAAEMPFAEQFIPEIENASDMLDLLDDESLPPGDRAKLLDAINTKIDVVQTEWRKEEREHMARTALAESMKAQIAALPMGHPRARQLQYDLSAVLGGFLDPDEWIENDMGLRAERQKSRQRQGEIAARGQNALELEQMRSQNDMLEQQAKDAAARNLAYNEEGFRRQGDQRKRQAERRSKNIERRDAWIETGLKPLIAAAESEGVAPTAAQINAWRKELGEGYDAQEKVAREAQRAQRRLSSLTDEQIAAGIKNALGDKPTAAPAEGGEAPRDIRFVREANAESGRLPGARRNGTEKPSTPSRESKALARIEAVGAKKLGQLLAVIGPMLPAARSVADAAGSVAKAGAKKASGLDRLEQLRNLPAETLEALADLLEGKQ